MAEAASSQSSHTHTHRERERERERALSHTHKKSTYKNEDVEPPHPLETVLGHHRNALSVHS